MFGTVINDELFLMEYTKHTVNDINEIPFTDFCMYVDTIYNKKLRDIKEQEAANGKRNKI